MYPLQQSFHLNQVQQLDLSIINSDQQRYYQVLQNQSVEKVSKWVSTIRSPPLSDPSYTNPSIPSDVGRIPTPNCPDSNCSLCHPEFSIHSHVVDQSHASLPFRANDYQPPPPSPNLEQLTIAQASDHSKQQYGQPFQPMQTIAPPPPKKSTTQEPLYPQTTPLPMSQFLQQVPPNFVPIFMLVPTPSPSHTQQSQHRVGAARNLMQNSLFQNPPTAAFQIPSIFSQSLQQPLNSFARFSGPAPPPITPHPNIQGLLTSYLYIYIYTK